jgi:hypothetical protein
VREAFSLLADFLGVGAEIPDLQGIWLYEQYIASLLVEDHWRSLWSLKLVI